MTKKKPKKFKHVGWVCRKGKPITEGCIIKMYHFTSALRREKNYMYKIAAIKNETLVFMDIRELYQLGKEKAHSCRVTEDNCSISEVIDAPFLY